MLASGVSVLAGAGVVSVVVAVLVRVEDVGEAGEDVAGLGDLVEDGGGAWLGCGEGGEFGFGLRAVVVELS
jgi:hypothetical protein